MSLGILHNALTPEQVTTLHECSKDFTTRNHFLFRDDPVFATVRDIILPHIQKFEGCDNIYKGFYLNIDYAAGIHTDEYYDRHALNTYLFPLEIEPIDSTKPYTTHTVVFNESYHSEYQPTDERYDVSEFWLQAPEVQPNCFYLPKEYVGHLKGLTAGVDLKKISLEAAFTWQLGSMIFFPRNRLHASGNTDLTNVRIKRALTMFTTGDLIWDGMK